MKQLLVRCLSILALSVSILYFYAEGPKFSRSELRPAPQSTSILDERNYAVRSIADTEADAATWRLISHGLPVPKRARDSARLLPFERELLDGFPPAKLGLQLYRSTNNTEVNTRRLQIAVVFFGLVKKLVAPQLAAFRNFVAAPLLSAGDVDVFLHTFEETNFSNPRNGEKSQSINQSKSIALLQNAFVGARRFRVAVSEAQEAHDFFGPTERYTRNGNPWKRDGSLSAHYFLRQQYSLIRGTEMWTSTNYRSHYSPQQHDNEVQMLLPNTNYSCVLYIRPDLATETPIAAETIRAMCRHDNDGHRELVVPYLEWNGLNDRTAFGTPEAMLLYGLRGLRLKAFIDDGGQISAEPYLFRYLCENKVAVHVAPWMVRRIRSDGSMEVRDMNKAILADRFVMNTDLWRDMQLRLHANMSGKRRSQGTRKSTLRDCLPRTLSSLPRMPAT